MTASQFVRGQSDPELKKYLWVVIRTQKDRKLQTLIEVCTDFASLSPTGNIHRPAEQTFGVEEDDSSNEMFAMMDRSQWTGQRGFGADHVAFVGPDVCPCSENGV